MFEPCNCTLSDHTHQMFTLTTTIFFPDCQPCSRMEAAYCSNGRYLYVFGGTRTCVSDAAFTRTFSHAISQFSCSEPPEVEPLGDLWMLDLASCQWTLLSNDALTGHTGPSPRSSATLAIDPSSTTLLLYSGRAARFSMKGLTDLWRFDLSSRVWSRIIGQHPQCVRAGFSAIHGGGLFVVDSRSQSESTEILRYDMAANRWSKTWCGRGGPVLESPVTGWVQDGRMYVYGIDHGSKAKTSSLWHVSLHEHGGWQQIIVSGVGAGPRFKGPTTSFCSEGAASFDPVSRKAYVFGGWNIHFNWFTIAADSGQLQQLEGRYWLLCGCIWCDACLFGWHIYIYITSALKQAHSCLQILQPAAGV